MGTVLPLPPIISRVGGVIADVAGAAAGAFLGAGGPPVPGGCPPRAGARAKGCRMDPCTGKTETFFLDTGCAVKKRRRRRGITATELRGFNKVNVLLNKVGKEPRKPRARR